MTKHDHDIAALHSRIDDLERIVKLLQALVEANAAAQRAYPPFPVVYPPPTVSPWAPWPPWTVICDSTDAVSHG